MDWLNILDSYAIVIAIVIVVIVILIVRHFRKKQEIESEKEEQPASAPEISFEDLPFNQEVSLLNNLKQQKKNAEGEIKNILVEGKALAKEKHSMETYYKEQSALIGMKINQLGMRNSTWKKQSDMLSTMIIEQEEMEEKLKGYKGK